MSVGDTFLRIIIEVFGLVASFVVVLSFFMQSEKSLRLTNLVGAAMFVIYGIAIHSIPNIVTNAAIIIAHGIRFYRTRKEKNNDESMDD